MGWDHPSTRNLTARVRPLRWGTKNKEIYSDLLCLVAQKKSINLDRVGRKSRSGFGGVDRHGLSSLKRGTHPPTLKPKDRWIKLSLWSWTVISWKSFLKMTSTQMIHVSWNAPTQKMQSLFKQTKFVNQSVQNHFGTFKPWRASYYDERFPIFGQTKNFVLRK